MGLDSDTIAVISSVVTVVVSVVALEATTGWANDKQRLHQCAKVYDSIAYSGLGEKVADTAYVRCMQSNFPKDMYPPPPTML